MDNKSIDKTKVILWNANSICKKTPELKEYINKSKPGWILITETHLKGDKKPPAIPEYRVTHKNRDNERRGGVAIYSHKSINITEIPLNTRGIETVAVKSDNITICCCYNRPPRDLEANDLEEIFANERVVACGDFNAKNRAWSCNTTNTAGRTLLGYTDDNGITVHAPAQPTYVPMNNTDRESILDIVIAKNVPVSNIEVHNELSSDHLPVMFKIKYPISAEDKDNKVLYQYAKARWNSYRTFINRSTHMKRTFTNEGELEDKLKEVLKLSTKQQKTTFLKHQDVQTTCRRKSMTS